jgi:hypothetical protein
MLRLLKRLLHSNYTEIRLEVASADEIILNKYNNSLGWYLDELERQKDMPVGIIYGGVLNGEKIIRIFYNQKEVRLENIKSYFKSKGIGLAD